MKLRLKTQGGDEMRVQNFWGAKGALRITTLAVLMAVVATYGGLTVRADNGNHPCSHCVDGDNCKDTPIVDNGQIEGCSGPFQSPQGTWYCDGDCSKICDDVASAGVCQWTGDDADSCPQIGSQNCGHLYHATCLAKSSTACKCSTYTWSDDPPKVCSVAACNYTP